MPRSLRNDRHHAGAERERLGGLVAMRDIERRRAIKDVHQLIALWMAFPSASAGEFGGEDRAVAIGPHPRRAALALCEGRLRRAAKKHPELRQLPIEIDDSDHTPLLPCLDDLHRGVSD